MTFLGTDSGAFSRELIEEDDHGQQQIGIADFICQNFNHEWTDDFQDRPGMHSHGRRCIFSRPDHANHRTVKKECTMSKEFMRCPKDPQMMYYKKICENVFRKDDFRGWCKKCENFMGNESQTRKK